jgi:nucleoid DNA-binding protein
MSVEDHVQALKDRLSAEQRAAEIREEVVKELTEQLAKERQERLSDFNDFQFVRDELVSVRRDLEMALAKINAARTVLG